MTINPTLIGYGADLLGPQLYPEETLVLSRGSIDITVDGLSHTGR